MPPCGAASRSLCKKLPVTTTRLRGSAAGGGFGEYTPLGTAKKNSERAPASDPRGSLWLLSLPSFLGAFHSPEAPPCPATHKQAKRLPPHPAHPPPHS